MKAWAIKLPDGGYLSSCSNAISWGRVSAKAVEDKNEAKHYKTEGIAKGVLKRHATERRNLAKQCKERQETGNARGNMLPADYYEKSIKLYTESADFIDKFVPVCVHVDAPSFIKPLINVKFEKQLSGFSIKKSQGNTFCKCCGVYLNKIPHAMFGSAFKKKARVCPWCIQERYAEIQTALEGMDSKIREEVEAERFLHKLS